jgi:hypothetical protein
MLLAMELGPYHRRVVDQELDTLLGSAAAISLGGPPAAGKTTTALQRAASVFELGRPEVAELAEAHPEAVVTSTPPILLDDCWRRPAPSDVVRRAVDTTGPPGRFLLTGASSTDDRGTDNIRPVRMRPLSLAERDLARPTVSLGELLRGARHPIDGRCDVPRNRYLEEVTASGLPAIRPLPEAARRVQLDQYLVRVVGHDLPQLGRPVRDQGSVRRWLTAYAAATATTVPYETIRDTAMGTQPDWAQQEAASAYGDLLERLFVLDPLAAWSPRVGFVGRLADAPKHHLADPALAVRLLDLEDTVLENPRARRTDHHQSVFVGALFESLLTLSVRVYAQAAGASVSHLRTYRSHHELDLIVERADGRVIAIDVKLSAEVDDYDFRHLRWLRRQLGEDLLDGLIVTAGERASRSEDGFAVVPAALLGP